MNPKIDKLKKEFVTLWEEHKAISQQLHESNLKVLENEQKRRDIQKVCEHERIHKSNSKDYNTICAHCDAWMDIRDGKAIIEYNP